MALEHAPLGAVESPLLGVPLAFQFPHRRGDRQYAGRHGDPDLGPGVAGRPDRIEHTLPGSRAATAMHSEAVSGRSFALNTTALLVPPRMKTAGILNRLIDRAR